jgi:hypothetical protein
VGRRPALALSVTGALAITSLSGVSPAAAATIHACVKKRSGATRIVKGRARCRKGEQKLSWGTTGPAGPPGTGGGAGKAGVNGANGAVAVFGASELERQPLALEKVAVIVSKVVPPGSYFVSAKTVILAEAEAAASAALSCGITDSPGTAYGPEHTTVDISSWESALNPKGAKEFKLVTTLFAQGTMTSTVTSTLALVCVQLSKDPGLQAFAIFSQLGAIQASQIG